MLNTIIQVAFGTLAVVFTASLSVGILTIVFIGLRTVARGIRDGDL